MDYDFLFPDSKCVICNSKVEPVSDTESTMSTCVNGCCYYYVYEISNKETLHNYRVFGKLYDFFESDEHYKKLNLELLKYEVDYWKENDRYLTKILIGE